MATDYSFDVVSKIDQQELDNALNQTRKEIMGRFDFKNSKTSIENTDKEITIISDDELKMKNVLDTLQAKLIKRGISIKAFDWGKDEPAASDTVRRIIKIQSGIPKDKCKPIIEKIKASKLKVNSQIQGEQIRISGKDKDDLQKAQQLLRDMDYEVPLQFDNYR
ncbi:MAG: YajQ family cyclic di-GMP-binding protein [Candidatus Eremiobacteraeota bacterium]|nr:YajQ family cyclic di-GMP-binding protein [Candidatus Eremiobacteraeota bacterium]